MNLQVILSCEHASQAIPKGYEYLFDHAEEDLNSHRGWDPGALVLMNYLADQMKVLSFQYPYTRLLIEPNRSPDHHQLFSEYSNQLNPEQKKLLLDEYYQPYRNRVELAIDQAIASGTKVIHLGIHSFTSVFDGVVRSTDIGILFDPQRITEVSFSALLKKALILQSEEIKVHDNRPYNGTDDGFTTYLRTRFGDNDYAGIELEVNQRFVTDGFPFIQHLLGEAVTMAVHDYDNRR